MQLSSVVGDSLSCVHWTVQAKTLIYSFNSFNPQFRCYGEEDNSTDNLAAG